MHFNKLYKDKVLHYFCNDAGCSLQLQQCGILLSCCKLASVPLYGCNSTHEKIKSLFLSSNTDVSVLFFLTTTSIPIATISHRSQIKRVIYLLSLQLNARFGG